METITETITVDSENPRIIEKKTVIEKTVTVEAIDELTPFDEEISREENALASVQQRIDDLTVEKTETLARINEKKAQRDARKAELQTKGALVEELSINEVVEK